LPLIELPRSLGLGIEVMLPTASCDGSAQFVLVVAPIVPISFASL
jgi:hypothetical protein